MRQVPGRFEKIENDLGLQIYVDYAHTDSALRSLLETARELKPGRILLVFGAGGDRDRAKRERMGEVAGRLADWTFLTSDNPRSEDPLAIIREIEKGSSSRAPKNTASSPTAAKPSPRPWPSPKKAITSSSPARDTKAIRS